LAAVGVTLRALDRMTHPGLATGFYLVMGWLVVIAIDPLMAKIATPGLLLLAAGGFAYTLGVVFFALDSRLRYGHFVWHLLAVAGTACHFFAVLDYAM
jgi:hemolysin III